MKYLLLAIFLVSVVLISGCIQSNNDASNGKSDMPNKTLQNTTPDSKTLQTTLNVFLGKSFTLHEGQSARIER